MKRIETQTVATYLEQDVAILTKTIRNTASSKVVSGYLMRKIADALDADMHATQDVSLYIAPLQRPYFVEQSASIMTGFNEGRYNQQDLITNMIGLLTRCTCAPELASKTECLRLDNFMAAVAELYACPMDVRELSIVAWRMRQTVAA